MLPEFKEFKKIPRLSRDIVITEKRCKECNKEFIPHFKQVKRQLFCNGDCRLKNWVKNNRVKLNENVRKYRAERYKREGRWRDEGNKAKELKKWMIELKSKPCTDCGGSFPVCCMDFDHKKGCKKEYNLGSMFAHHYSRALIEKELKKCDLVCSNCHRIRTQERRTGNGKYK